VTCEPANAAESHVNNTTIVKARDEAFGRIGCLERDRERRHDNSKRQA
jgi:hypothetical protein